MFGRFIKNGFGGFVKSGAAAGLSVMTGLMVLLLGTSVASAQFWSPEQYWKKKSGTSSSTGFTSNTSWNWGSTPTTGRRPVKLITKHRPGTIIVSFGDRRIYKIVNKTKAISYPIAVPKGDAKWSGINTVSRKMVNPKWTPTAEMRRENPKLPDFVAGGDPRNPLGVRALYLGSTLYRIHGTDAPWLIGKAVSKGCIRMYNKDVIDLYNQTNVGAKVITTWKKYKAYPL